MTTLPNISPELIKKYQEEISKNSSEATSKRKTASLNKFFDWAEDSGHIDASPMPAPTQNPGNSYVVTNTSKSHNVGLKTWAILGTTFGIIILIFLLTLRLGSPIEYIKNFAAGTDSNPTAQVVINNQNVLPSNSPESTISASLAANPSWNLYANLKLTDDNGVPQVGSKTITFKIYNTENGGESLFTSDSQTVTTDSNGSALISLDQVPSDLFFQNNKLFLEPVIGSASASTRIPVSTANSAANLGGYFPGDPDLGAGELTVPVIDGNGSLNLASQSPAINGKSGNLLVQGQAVTIKAVDGGNGNIEINPDGSGIAHFLFEGSNGNFLNAQAPNLNKGSLYYGIVANNSTGYNLLKLQNGSKAITRFSVDALGNTNATGNINAGVSLQTSGVNRVTSTGKLENITGYSQNSGNFVINQNPGDFASIVKTGTALNNAATMTLDERGATPNTSYSTLVLNRYNAFGTGMALLVSNGNAQFDGIVKIGNYATNPSNIGTGSLVYNTTDNKVYYWDGTFWQSFATGANSFSGSFADLTGGTNTAGAMVVGTGASLTFSGTGTINATDVTCTGCVANTELANSGITVNSGGILSGGGTVALGGTLNLAATEADTLSSVTGRGATTDTQVSFNGGITSTGDLTLSPTGNVSITKPTTLNGVTYTWPGAASNGYVLQSGGTGTSSTLTWVDPAAAVASSIYWTSANGALFPKNNSIDVLIGSDSTASAKFAFTGVASGTPTASIAGSVAGVSTYLTGNGTLATTNGNHLTIGGITTGGIDFGSPITSGTWNGTAIGATYGGTGQTSYAVGDLLYADTTSTLAKLADIATGNVLISGGVGVAPSWNKVVLGTHTSGNYVSTLTGTANQIDVSASTGDITLTIPSDFRAPGTVNATTGLYTGSTAGTQRIDASGNLTNIGTTQLNGVAYTWPGADGEAAEVLSTNGAGSLSWAPALTASSVFWTQDAINGVLYPKNNTVDMLVGSNATSSAKFAFTGVAGGTPTASISGTYLTSTGNLANTNMEDITLGGATTGNVIADSPFTANSTVTLPNSNVLTGVSNYIQSSNGYSVGGGTTYHFDSSGNVVANDIAVNGGNITTTNATGNLFNTGATALNIGGAANTLAIGAAASTTTFGSTTVTLGGNSTINGGTGSGGTLTLNSTTNGTKGNIHFFNTSNSIDSSGNLTVAGNASASGNLTLAGGARSIQTTAASPLTIGGGTTGNITLNPSNSIAGGFVAPATTNASDLGTSSLLWRNIYATTLYQNGSLVCDATGTNCPFSGGYWQAAAGALNPINNTYDLLIGSNSTTSAKFAFTGVSGGLPTASIAGTTANAATYLTGDGNLAVTNGTNLTLGGATTGNVIANSPFNAVNGLYTGGAAAGTQRIDASGNLTNIGTTQLNGVTYTWPAAATANYVLQAQNTGTSSTLAWVDPAAAIASNIYWTGANGALFPKNSSLDVLIGADATTSAKFAFTGVSGGTPTASISGTYLTSTGTLANTSMRNLTLGGATTGNIIIPNGNVGIGTVVPSAKLSFAQDTVATGGIDFGGDTNLYRASANYLQTDSELWSTNKIGVNTTGAGTIDLNTTNSAVVESFRFLLNNAVKHQFGNYTGNNDFFIDSYNSSAVKKTSLTLNADTLLFNIDPNNEGWKITFGGDTNLYRSTANTLKTDDSMIITGNLGLGTAPSYKLDVLGDINTTGALRASGNSGTAGQVLTSTGTGISWANAADGTNYWDLQNGALYPFNSSVDLLIGASATSSAKFAFTGVSGGLPTASISGTYLTSTGTLANTNMEDITLGGATTGNVIADSPFTANSTVTLPNSNILTGVANYLQLSQGVSVGGGITYHFDANGNINAAGITGTSIIDSGLTANKVVFTDGTKTLASTGTVGADQGGTGFSSYAVGDLLYADTTSTLAKLADIATGNVLISGGVGVAPSWNKVVLGTHTSGNYVSTLTGTANQIDVSASTGDITLTIPSDFRAPGTVNATTGLYTGSTAGTQRIDASGNLTNIGTTQLNGVAYTWPGADAALSGYVLSSNAAGVLSWVDNGAGAAGTWTIDAANGVHYANSQTADVLIGGMATSSAKFAFTGLASGLPTASISGNIAGVNTYLTGNGNLATTNMHDLILGGSTTGNVVINSRGLTSLTANGINLTTGGNLALADTYTLQAGGATGTAYNVFANIGESPIGAAAIAAITTDNDLFVGGDFQAAGTIYDSSGNVLAGYWSQSGSNLYPTTLTNLIGIGTNSPLSRLSVVNNPAGGSLTGKAAFLIDQYENEDIFTASASGQTKLTLTNDGTLKLYNATSSISNDAGDITINAASNFISFSGDSIGNINDLTAAGEIVLAGGSASTGCTITNSTGNLVCSGQGTFGGALQAGTISSPTSYSRLVNSSATVTNHGFTTAQDLLIGGNLELDGVLYLDGRVIANPTGVATIIFATDPSAVNSPNILDDGVWWINNNVNNGMASLMVNQEKAGDIFSASASGTAKFTIHNDGAITLAGMSSTTNTAEGTVYYDTDVDHLYLRTGDSAFHRLAMDMTKYTTTAANIANLGYVQITHNQNTNDINLTGWVKNTLTNLWEKITDKSVTMKQSLQNEFDSASASAKIRTQTRLTDIELKPSVDVGTGSDGAITVSSNTNINTNPLISGRTTACTDATQQGDAVNYSVTALTSTTATVTPTPSTGCLVAGDEILLINLQGTNSAFGNVGNYETLRVGSIASNVITFRVPKAKFYGDTSTGDTNIGTADGTQKVMIQRVPNYTNVTVNSGFNFTPSAWNRVKGGVMFFRATGTVTVSGSINATGIGYFGGGSGGGSASFGYGGESYCNGSSTGAHTGGRSGNSSTTPTAGICGGGGGGGITNSTGAAGSSIGGAGGAAGGTTANTGAHPGGGAGGGYGSPGNRGTGSNGYTASNGTNGGSPASGAGGNWVDSGAGYYSGGGGGGGTYGDTALDKLMFGSGGGAGGSGTSTSPTGGAGGGIISIASNTINVSGGINSNGGAGGNGDCSNVYPNNSAGSGAGGSLKLIGSIFNIGNSLVTASPGAVTCSGGAGGNGRTAIYYVTSYSGSTSSPTPTYSVQPYYPYGLYHSGVIATPNAVTLSDLRWDATPSAYGKIEFQTRTGNTTNPADGSWESWKPAVASTNYLSVQDANTHTDWTGTNFTVADGDITRSATDIPFFEDETEATAGNITKGTSSTNGGYAEATIASANLSNYDYLTFWVRSSQAGNILQIGMGEAAATEQTELITIDATNTWQKVYWDLSDIATASRDAITKLRLTNLVASSNTIYIDNIKAEKAMTNNSGTPIASTPNNYLQYRAIFTTTNTSFQPQVNNVQFSYNNSYKIDQTDANNVRLYNYTGQNQELRLDAVVFGADLAEYYAVNDQNIGEADVVAVTGNLDDYGVPVLRKSQEVNDPGLIGVISTNAGQTLGIDGDDRRLLALAGRVPVKIASNSASIKYGDMLTSSGEPGRAKKASIGEKSIGTALESWSPESGKNTITVFVGTGSVLTPTLSDLRAYYLNAKVNAEGIGYEITNSIGETVNNIGIYSQMLVANITAGVVKTNDLIAQKIQTPLISPLADGTDITVRIGSDATPSGKFAIQNSTGTEVASIDTQGNATFSGTLYADDIKSKGLEDIQKLLAQVQTDQFTLLAATSSAELTASGSANIAELITTDMFVTGQATLSSVSIADSLTLGSDLVIGLGGNTINSLSTPLEIQSLAMAPVEIMGGLITIDTQGNMQVAGNLNVAGRINSSGLTLKDNQNPSPESSPSASLLSLQDINGNQVSSVDASGSANFNSISASQFVVAAGGDATNSAVINGVITTNATAGTAQIPAGVSEITIKNPKVTDYTLVYVTPTSGTQNNVLYVKSKSAGQFVVGFTDQINIDANFNWWIVQVIQ